MFKFKTKNQLNVNILIESAMLKRRRLSRSAILNVYEEKPMIKVVK